MGGNVGTSRSKDNSDFASVAEQSGIKAGDGGFQVRVKGDTELNKRKNGATHFFQLAKLCLLHESVRGSGKFVPKILNIHLVLLAHANHAPTHTFSPDQFDAVVKKLSSGGMFSNASF